VDGRGVDDLRAPDEGIKCDPGAAPDATVERDNDRDHPRWQIRGCRADGCERPTNGGSPQRAIRERVLAALADPPHLLFPKVVTNPIDHQPKGRRRQLGNPPGNLLPGLICHGDGVPCANQHPELLERAGYVLGRSTAVSNTHTVSVGRVLAPIIV